MNVSLKSLSWWSLHFTCPLNSMTKTSVKHKHSIFLFWVLDSSATVLAFVGLKSLLKGWLLLKNQPKNKAITLWNLCINQTHFQRRHPSPPETWAHCLCFSGRLHGLDAMWLDYTSLLPVCVWRVQSRRPPHKNEFRSGTSSIRSLHPLTQLHNCMHMLTPPQPHTHTHTPARVDGSAPLTKFADGSETNQLCRVCPAPPFTDWRLQPPGGDTERSPTLFQHRSKSQQEAGSSVQSLLTRSLRHNSAWTLFKIYILPLSPRILPLLPPSSPSLFFLNPISAWT